jgi:geranylgeranyl diphosphate synthase, type I
VVTEARDVTASTELFVEREAALSTTREPAPANEFARYAAVVRPKVEARLDAWLAAKAAEGAELPAAARAPIEAAFELARRGGKRWRAVLVACAYDAFLGEGGADAVVMAGVAMELLQVYLLIHDDWMDGDDLRRGGPSVPAMMRARFGATELADASAILAGDYTAGLALDALLSVPCAGDRVVLAARELARVEEEVVLGQLLDVNPSPDAAIESTHALKTASYTVRAPVLIGARLAGASDDACRALEAFAVPLGVAFQLRDDILGTFGDPTSTGKPPFSDLRRGKRTALIAEAARDPGARGHLKALGDPAATHEALVALAARLDASGARARVEARIEALLLESRAALLAAPLSEAGRLVLTGAIATLGNREN